MRAVIIVIIAVIIVVIVVVDVVVVVVIVDIDIIVLTSCRQMKMIKRNFFPISEKRIFRENRPKDFFGAKNLSETASRLINVEHIRCNN